MKGRTILAAVWLVLVVSTRAGTLAPSYWYDPTTPPVTYNDGAGKLTNGVIGTTDFNDPAWVGFSTPTRPFPTKVVFDFGTIVNITNIVISALNNPVSSIAPLKIFTASYGYDRETFGSTQTFATTEAEQAGDPAVASVVRPLSGQGRYLQLSLDHLTNNMYLFISEVTFQGVALPTNTPYRYVYDAVIGYPDLSLKKLTDGVVGSTSYSDPAWVGFYTPYPAQVTFDFGFEQDFAGITIAGLNTPGAGINPLKIFNVSFSSDGAAFGATQTFYTTSSEQSGLAVVSKITRLISGQGRYLRLNLDSQASDYLFISEVTFNATQRGMRVIPAGYTYQTNPSPDYPDSGGRLTNGVIGVVTNYHDPEWIAFVNSYPATMTFDFGGIVNIGRICIVGMNWPIGGIDPLKRFTVSMSDDGSTFGATQTFDTTTAEQTGNPAVMVFARDMRGKGRYLRLAVDPQTMWYLFMTEVAFGFVPPAGGLIFSFR